MGDVNVSLSAGSNTPTQRRHRGNTSVPGSLLPSPARLSQRSLSVCVKFMDLHCGAVCSASPKTVYSSNSEQPVCRTTKNGVSVQWDAYFPSMNHSESIHSFLPLS